MTRTGPKRGRDNIYELVKAQYCEPTDEERLALKTPQASCIHCNVGQTRNTSEMHWHLCVCTAFGSKDPTTQNLLRSCVPDSILRSHKKRAMYQSWQNSSGIVPSEDNDEPKKNYATKKAKLVDNKSLNDEINKLIAKWVYMYRIPASAIESQEFRDIIMLLNPESGRLPDRNMLSGALMDSLYQQTHSDVSNHFNKCEGLQLRLPSETVETETSGDDDHDKSLTCNSVQIFDGRGSFFYKPLILSGHRNVSVTYTQRLLDTASPIADMKNSIIVSILHNPNRDYSEEGLARSEDLLHAIETRFSDKICLSNSPFSPLSCAELMLTNIAAVHQATTHAQCLLQYFQQNTSPPGTIIRNIIASMRSDAVGSLGMNFTERLKLPDDNSVQSVSEMLEVVNTAQLAGVFNRVLIDSMYQNYCRTLSDSSAAQTSMSVQSILVSEAAMSGIEQAAFSLRLLLTAAHASQKPHSATFSDSMALRDALVTAVASTTQLSPPWKTMVTQVIASQWEHSYHMLIALACKLDPRRRFVELSSKMESDAQRMRDRLIASLDSAQRKAVIDSWVQMLKRDDCFGEPYALDTASSQSPVDWWIAHTAAHKELREFVAFPALTTLGVVLTTGDPYHNSMSTDTHFCANICDPTRSGNPINVEFDSTETVRTAELSSDLMRNTEQTEKLAFIRRNCWSLHHVRREARSNTNHRRRFHLLTSTDLLQEGNYPSTLPTTDQQQHQEQQQQQSQQPSQLAAQRENSLQNTRDVPSDEAVESAYASIEEFEFAHDTATTATSAVGSNTAHLPDSHVFSDHSNAYITLHPSGAPTQQLHCTSNTLPVLQNSSSDHNHSRDNIEERYQNT